MKILDILTERVSASFPLVVVDVQPAYEHVIRFDINHMVEMLNSRKGKTVMYVNVYDDSGTSEDSIHEIQQWWYGNGVNEDQLNRFNFIDKGYGYLRTPVYGMYVSICS